MEERLFQEQKKALQNGMRIAPIRQVLPKFQAFEHWHMQLEINLHLFVYGYQTWQIETEIIYCFSFAKRYQPRVETSVKLATKVSCSSTFAEFSFL